MRKLLSLLLCALFAALSVGTASFVFADEEKTTDPDSVIEAALDDFDTVADKLEKRKLFDYKFDDVGYVYDFVERGNSGFAVVLREGAEYVVEELFLNSENPYFGAEVPVYGGYLCYLKAIGKNIYNAVTNELLVSTRRYGVTSFIDSELVQINYERKTDTTKTLTRLIPTYMSSSYQNSCANIAGGIIVGYYDAVYSELIPNFSAYQNGAYVTQDSHVTAVIDGFYTSMNTNVDNGTSFVNFKSGLTSYVNGVGRNIAYSELASNGNISVSNIQNYTSNQIPIVVFLNTYNAINMYYNYSGYDKICTNYYSGSHTMVTYGYRLVSYYRTESKKVWSPVWYNPFRTVTVNEEVNFRNDDYLMVNAIIPGTSRGYLRLNDNTTVDHALAVRVF